MVFHKKVQKLMNGINSMAVMDSDTFEKEKIHEYYRILQENGIKNLSIEGTLVNKEFLEIFSGINLFVWTVDKISDYEQLENLGIKNICTNKITHEKLEGL
jgi:hypothetical protein